MLRKGILNTLGNVIQRGSVLLIYVIAARGMEAKTFGIASSLVALAITIGSISSLSLGQTANRTLSRLRLVRLRTQIAINIIQVAVLTSLVSTGVFFLFSSELIQVVISESVSITDVISVGICIAAISLGASLKGHIWADMRYGVLLVSAVASAIALFFCYYIALEKGWPLPLLQAYTAMVITEAVIIGGTVTVPLMKANNLLILPSLRQLKPVMMFSGLATLNGLIFTPVNIIIISLIASTIGNEMAGRFNILVQIRNAIIFLPSSFASVLLTFMSRDRKNNNHWRNSLLLSLMAAMVAVPISVIAYIWRPMGINTEYIQMLIITSITAILIAFNTNVGQAFLALGQIQKGIMGNIIWSITTIGLVYMVLNLKIKSLAAVLVAIMVAYILHTVIQLYLIGRKPR